MNTFLINNFLKINIKFRIGQLMNFIIRNMCPILLRFSLIGKEAQLIHLSSEYVTRNFLTYRC
jgi:hypothetical protein